MDKSNKKTIKVFVASKNPVKIETTKLGFQKMFPNQTFEVMGVSVPSNVSAQPMSEKETLQGARNRVEHLQKFCPDADFWVGIEGGIEEFQGGLETFAWMVIKSKKGIIGTGRSASFFIPEVVADLVRLGKELGEADDLIFGRTNSKQSTGSVGLLTGDVLTRTSFYEQGIILALIPFKNPELY